MPSINCSSKRESMSVAPRLPSTWEGEREGGREREGDRGRERGREGGREGGRKRGGRTETEWEGTADKKAAVFKYLPPLPLPPN